MSERPTAKAAGLQFKKEAEARAPSGKDKPALKLTPPSGKAAGLANYQATLGKRLGGPLYGALRDSISLDTVGGYADSIVAAGVRAAAGQLSLLDPDIDDKVIGAFGDAMVASTSGAGSKLVRAEGRRMVAVMEGFIDANPEIIAGITVLAATGAILADMDIPTLHQRFGITEELNLDVSARLGSIRNIALEKVEARLSYETGRLKVVMAVETGQDGVKASAGLTLEF